MADNYPVPRPLRSSRSRVTNGRELLPGLDGRSKWARRLHDLVANHVIDLGGATHVTQSQFALIRAAATTTIVLEKWELQFATEGTINMADLLGYQTTLNSLRRVLETLGLNRVDPAANTAPALDLTKFTDAELHRFNALMHKADEIGADRMAMTEVNEMQKLIDKSRGWGVGPSISDRAHRRRPFNEIDYSEQGR
ncbi:hypothetical protein [Mesorhizobium sp.]|uniref:hypothetical protein n=1 Tax=Mesorhizobium sp. TaxID=1871066 RepID=UPI000FD21E36|nr:hypothetical protein [Mesorhizobium sp.]RVC64386.1 hypothetical protein EN779_02015 [Mesorhizobium sp. M4B.F.Ca.ET.088.02.2.1]RWF27661.1 MAG: hypothetical protein EOS45_25130 [Mesorhizobium sp.]